MPLFTDILNDVYTITNRSDLVAESKLAVKQATIDAHRSEFYPKDLVDGLQIAITPASAIWQLSIPANFARWRAFAYLRPYSVVSGTLSKIIIGRNQFLSPDAILDEYLEEKLNVAYVAGTNLNMRLEGAYDGMLCAYYSNPIIDETTYDSWVATDHPGVIQIDAGRRVLAMIGYEEAAARLTQLMFGSRDGSWQNIQGGEAAVFKTAALEGVAS